MISAPTGADEKSPQGGRKTNSDGVKRKTHLRVPRNPSVYRIRTGTRSTGDRTLWERLLANGGFCHPFSTGSILIFVVRSRGSTRGASAPRVLPPRYCSLDRYLGLQNSIRPVRKTEPGEKFTH